jgi:hypothetical protein
MSADAKPAAPAAPAAPSAGGSRKKLVLIVVAIAVVLLIAFLMLRRATKGSASSSAARRAVGAAANGPGKGGLSHAAGGKGKPAGGGAASGHQDGRVALVMLADAQNPGAWVESMRSALDRAAAPERVFLYVCIPSAVFDTVNQESLYQYVRAHKRYLPTGGQLHVDFVRSTDAAGLEDLWQVVPRISRTVDWVLITRVGAMFSPGWDAMAHNLCRSAVKKGAGALFVYTACARHQGATFPAFDFWNSAGGPVPHCLPFSTFVIGGPTAWFFPTFSLAPLALWQHVVAEFRPQQVVAGWGVDLDRDAHALAAWLFTRHIILTLPPVPASGMVRFDVIAADAGGAGGAMGQGVPGLPAGPVLDWPAQTPTDDGSSSHQVPGSGGRARPPIEPTLPSAWIEFSGIDMARGDVSPLAALGLVGGNDTAHYVERHGSEANVQQKLRVVQQAFAAA